MTGVEPALAAAAMGTAAGAGTATAAGLTAAEIAALAAAAETAAATAAPAATAYGLAAPAIAAEVAAPTVAATTTGGGLLGSAGTATGMEAGSAFGPMSGINEFGYQGLSSLYSNPANTQFMTGTAGELAGIGGQGQSLATTAANAMTMPASASSGLSTNDAFRLAQQGYKMANGQDKQQQPGRPMMMPGSPEEMAQRRRNGFGELAPYQNRQGFTPRRYGANLRRGLLEG